MTRKLRLLLLLGLFVDVACVSAPPSSAPPPRPSPLFVKWDTEPGDCRFLGGAEDQRFYREDWQPLPEGCACEPLLRPEEAAELVKETLLEAARGFGANALFVDHVWIHPAFETPTDCCPRRRLKAEVYFYACPDDTLRALEAFRDPFF